MCGLFGFIKKDITCDTDIVELNYCAIESGKRGPHAFGIAIHSNSSTSVIVKEGLISSNIDIVLKNSNANCMIGHTRLSTYGDIYQGQPIFNTVALAHNGNIYQYVNIYKLYPNYEKTTDIDSEVLLASYLAKGKDEVYKHIRDAKNPNVAMIMDNGSIHVFRNKNGHPLFVFEDDKIIYFSSIQVNKKYELFNKGVFTYGY